MVRNSGKVLVILADFNELEFSRQIFEKTLISNFMIVLLLGAEFFFFFIQADGQIDMAKLKVTFRNLGTRLKIGGVSYYGLCGRRKPHDVKE